MEQPEHVNRWIRWSRSSLVTGLVAALLIAGMARLAGAQNTAFGTGALGKVTTGTNNSAFGFDALFENTTGHDNTAVGANALFTNTTGYVNTATGINALYSN